MIACFFCPGPADVSLRFPPASSRVKEACRSAGLHPSVAQTQIHRSLFETGFLLCLLLFLGLQPLFGGRSEGIRARPFADDLPLLFEPNQGQLGPEGLYGARGSNFVALLKQDSIALRSLLPGSSGASEEAGWICLRWVGGNPSPVVERESPAPMRVSRFRGNRPEQWSSNMAASSSIRYREIYPGVDLRVYGRPEYLEYDFVLSPGTDPDQIRLRFDGAEEVRLDENGKISLDTSNGALTQLLPQVFQFVNGNRRPVDGSYRLDANQQLSFDLGPYDSSLELTIDPVLSYSSYLGGSQGDVPAGVTVDSQGNFYVMGSTGSSDFPVRDAFQPEFSGGGATNGDLYVTKIDPSGRKVLYSTYIGGETTDIGRGIAVDEAGRAYLVGTTFSDDFPTTPGAYQTVCSGRCPFVVRLSPDGDLEYATFIGRGDGLGIGVDGLSRAVIVGRTTSADFPTVGAFQPTSGGMSDAFISRLNSDGTSVTFSSFLGGSGDESLNLEMDLAVDSQNAILVVGTTVSADFPTLNPVQAALQGEEDVFLTKVSAAGRLVYSTYLGGSEDDNGRGVAVDSTGNAYVTGETKSPDFPTVSALQNEYGGGIGIGDAFLARVSTSGGSLLYSTFLGGEGGDRGVDVAVDSLDRAVLVGTGTSGFPLADPLLAFDGVDNFVLKMTEDGKDLVYSTAFGGGDSDIRVATLGTDVYLAGNSSSGDDPVLKALQPRRTGSADTFFAQISDAGELYFAQFANGPGAVSEVLLTNSSPLTASTAIVRFRGDDGLPIELDLTISDADSEAGPVQTVGGEVTVTVEPFGMVKITTDGQGDVLIAGSVTVVYDQPLGGVVRFNLTPFGTAGVGESELVQGFITPVRNTAIATGVAIFNSEESQTGIRLRLRTVAGEEVAGGLRTTAIPARGHLAQFIEELFPDADLENFEGTLTVEATSLNSLIAGTALELGTGPGQFTTLPITPLP